MQINETYHLGQIFKHSLDTKEDRQEYPRTTTIKKNRNQGNNGGGGWKGRMGEECAWDVK